MKKVVYCPSGTFILPERITEYLINVLDVAESRIQDYYHRNHRTDPHLIEAVEKFKKLHETKKLMERFEVDFADDFVIQFREGVEILIRL